jgi:pyruvate/oxaloacetate carboxyltransferase
VKRVIAWCDEKSSNINPVKTVALWCSLDNKILRADVPAIKIKDLSIVSSIGHIFSLFFAEYTQRG